MRRCALARARGQGAGTTDTVRAIRRRTRRAPSTAASSPGEASAVAATVATATTDVVATTTTTRTTTGASRRTYSWTRSTTVMRPLQRRPIHTAADNASFKHNSSTSSNSNCRTNTDRPFDVCSPVAAAVEAAVAATATALVIRTRRLRSLLRGPLPLADRRHRGYGIRSVPQSRRET